MSELHRFLRFYWDAVTAVAARRFRRSSAWVSRPRRQDHHESLDKTYLAPRDALSLAALLPPHRRRLLKTTRRGPARHGGTAKRDLDRQPRSEQDGAAS